MQCNDLTTCVIQHRIMRSNTKLKLPLLLFFYLRSLSQPVMRMKQRTAILVRAVQFHVKYLIFKVPILCLFLRLAFSLYTYWLMLCFSLFSSQFGCDCTKKGLNLKSASKSSAEQLFLLNKTLTFIFLSVSMLLGRKRNHGGIINFNILRCHLCFSLVHMLRTR